MAASDNQNPQVIAIDAGGTMTDTFVVSENGEFTVGKAKTTPENESIGVVDSSADALRYWDLDLETAFGSVETGVYSGTAMVNRLVERESEENVGIITTKGMEDNLRMGRGKQSYQGYSYEDRLHIATHRHPEPIVPREQIKGVQERINGFGQTVCPLYEDDVQRAVRELLDQDVDTIVVCLMHSYENGSHEREVKEIAEEVMESTGKSVPVNLSSEKYPRREEVPRLNTITAEAYAAQPTRKQFEYIQEAVRENNGEFDVRVMASHGGTIDPGTDELARTLVSGPIGGLIGGITLADEIDRENIVCTDIGGTSFDMGVITGNDFVIDYRPSVARLLLSLPMVDIDTVGAGTGSYVRIDPVFDRLELGPDSAGDEVGVCNQDADVDTVTVTDCHVAMGIISPDNFLEGRLDIDKDVAIEAVRNQVADPLDLDVYEACQTVIDVLESRLGNSLEGVISGSGLAAGNYSCLSYGGGGPVHTAGYTQSFDFQEVLVPTWAAGFSAYGCGAADYEYRYDQTTTTPIGYEASDDTKKAVGEELTEIWKGLEEKVLDQFAPEHGRDDVTFIHEFRAQYQGQLESITVESPVGRVETPDDMDMIIDAFERTYAEKYAEQARSPELGHNFTQLTVRGVVDIVKPKIPYEEERGSEPEEDAYKGEREVYLDSEWHTVPILEMNGVNAGNEIEGPAIIEDPATTYVVPAGYETRLDNNRIFHLESKSQE